MEYTAKQFEVVFFDEYVKWLRGGKVGPDPCGLWEYQSGAHQWKSFTHSVMPTCILDLADRFRWKPTPKRTVVIDGKTLVAPEREPLVIGQGYFRLGQFGYEGGWYWNNYLSDYDHLKFGLVFLTAEDAQAMFEAQKAQRLGA